MATRKPSPDVKVEADSCTLTSASCDASVLPMHVPSPMTSSDDPVTPKSMTDDDTSPRALSVIPEQSPEPASTLSAEDKEPAKKRKSWGQVLPEPKTNLPPRKRAKTDDEKEQRRVERVLRNRRAAQSSRERKRLETEALENRNKELESELLDAQQANVRLLEEIKNLRLHLGIPSSQPPLESLCNKPIMLSPQLFGSSSNTEALPGHSVNLVGQILSSVIPTVDPSSLSPKLAPSPEQGKSPRDKPVGQQTKRPSLDLTQRPAEMLCDLQCQESVDAVPSLPIHWIAMAMKGGFSLRPTRQITRTILRLVTSPPPTSPLRTRTHSSTWVTTSTRTRLILSRMLRQQAMSLMQATTLNIMSPTLRYESLRKILSSSPNLARPLMDATVDALRLVSSGFHWAEHSAPKSYVARGHGRRPQKRVSRLPSVEALLALICVMKQEKGALRFTRTEMDSLATSRGTDEPTRVYSSRLWPNKKL